jgi:hypothetical protein
MSLQSCSSCSRHAAFSGARLLKGAALDEVTQKLEQQLAEDLLKNPPHDMRWLSSLEDDAKVSSEHGLASSSCVAGAAALHHPCCRAWSLNASQTTQAA